MPDGKTGFRFLYSVEETEDKGLGEFAASALIFGLVHFYQGWAGVILTTFPGVILTLVYLATGHLWIAMVVHAAIDLNGLILQPFLASLIRNRQDLGDSGPR